MRYFFAAPSTRCVFVRWTCARAVLPKVGEMQQQPNSASTLMLRPVALFYTPDANVVELAIGAAPFVVLYYFINSVTWGLVSLQVFPSFSSQRGAARHD